MFNSKKKILKNIKDDLAVYADGMSKHINVLKLRSEDQSITSVERSIAALTLAQVTQANYFANIISKIIE